MEKKLTEVQTWTDFIKAADSRGYGLQATDPLLRAHVIMAVLNNQNKIASLNQPALESLRFLIQNALSEDKKSGQENSSLRSS